MNEMFLKKFKVALAALVMLAFAACGGYTGSGGGVGEGEFSEAVTIDDKVWKVDDLNMDYNPDSTKGDRPYVWAAAMDSASVLDKADPHCPDGFRLPNKGELEELVETAVQYVNGNGKTGHSVKSGSSGTGKKEGKVDYAGAIAMSMLASDYKEGYYVHSFHGEDRGMVSWTPTKYSKRNPHALYMYYSEENAFMDYYSKDVGFTVRCVKSEET